jgi:hypothetical protein
MSLCALQAAGMVSGQRSADEGAHGAAQHGPL